MKSLLKAYPFVIAVLFVCSIHATAATKIIYELNNLGSGRWSYTYDVININLPEGIEEFTVWFDVELYENLTLGTLDPPASNWDEILWQPVPPIGTNGGYDALAMNLDILPGEHVYGFAVSFDWLGTGEPGLQYYEVINPVDFSVINSGFTIPEPMTAVLFGFGSFIMLRRQQ